MMREISVFIITENLDVFPITEAWLISDSRDSTTITDIQNTVQDFKFLNPPRKGKRGGGICVILCNLYCISLCYLVGTVRELAEHRP